MGCNINIKQEKRKHPNRIAMEQMEEILAEADRNLGQSRKIQEDLVINRDAIHRFMNLDHFSETDRAKAKKTLQEWQDELDRDAEKAAEDARDQMRKRGPGRKAPKPLTTARQKMRI